jgi:hypothetical protein
MLFESTRLLLAPIGDEREWGLLCGHRPGCGRNRCGDKGLYLSLRRVRGNGPMVAIREGVACCDESLHGALACLLHAALCVPRSIRSTVGAIVVFRGNGFIGLYDGASRIVDFRFLLL